MRKTIVVLAVLLATALSGQEDPNAWVRALGDKGAADQGDAARVVALLDGATVAGPAEAIAHLQKKGIIKGQYDANKPLTLGTLALLVMRTKGYKGGLFWTIFGSPRYAHRELVYKKILPASESEYAKVSGGLLLAVIARVKGDVPLEIKEVK